MVRVRFFLQDEGREFTVPREQAEHLLSVLGFDPEALPPLHPLAPWSSGRNGALLPADVVRQSERLARQYISGRFREFTSDEVSFDSLVVGLLAVTKLAEEAAGKGQQVFFEELEGTT